MARTSFWTALTVAVLAIGGGAYYYVALHHGPATVAQAAISHPETSVTVEAAPVTVDTVVDDIRAVGSLRPNESVIVSPEIPGRIARIRFHEGDTVSAGDVLVELDASVLRAELAKAKSEMALADANNQRATTLARQGIGTLRARDEAVAAHSAAQANLQLAEARNAQTVIYAPLTGVVGLRSVSVGAYVMPGDRIVELADVDPIKVDFRVPELALTSLHTGQPIQLTVDALPGRTFDGEVYAIDPIVDDNGRAVRLRARVANPERELFAGLFARIRIVVGRREDSVLVPESAVFAQGKKRFVYKVVDDRAVLTEIELGQRRPGLVEVSKGLGPEAVVVAAGYEQVRDGSRVTVTNSRSGT